MAAEEVVPAATAFPRATCPRSSCCRRPCRPTIAAWATSGERRLQAVGAGHDRGRHRGRRLRGARFRQLPGLAEESLGHDPQTRKFCERFVERAFRRPLTDAQRQLYIDRRFRDVPDLDSAVRRVVMLALVSPRFLYVPTRRRLQYGRASRLSLALWDSLPDDACWRPRQRGDWPRPSRSASRPGGCSPTRGPRAKLRLFFLQWLKVETPPDLAKDPKSYGTFDAAVATDLRTSLKMFLDDVMWSEASDFRQLLLTADYLLERPAGRLLRREAAGRGRFPEGGLRAAASGRASSRILT